MTVGHCVPQYIIRDDIRLVSLNILYCIVYLLNFIGGGLQLLVIIFLKFFL